MRVPRKLAFRLAALMTVQSLPGLIAPEQYRAVEWIKVTWLGGAAWIASRLSALGRRRRLRRV